MKLSSLSFCRFKGKPNEWSLLGKNSQPINFGQINLVVGKNASGKSQIISTLHCLAHLFRSSKIRDIFPHSEFELKACFELQGKPLVYDLEVKAEQVVQELLYFDNELKLDRQKGIIWNQETHSFLSFEISPDISAASKADKKQYPYLQELEYWGKNLSFFRFGSSLGKDTFMKVGQTTPAQPDQNALLILSTSSNSTKLKKQTLKDMAFLGYKLQDIGLKTVSIHNLPAGITLKVVENGHEITQSDMSQGMFRVLSLLLQLNYKLTENPSACLLIDDIGEGLDHQRSKSMIDLLLEKTKKFKLQVIMTTNDRFVMNKVPLENWLVVHKTDKESVFYNYQNSKEIFDEYKYSGMSNFDFLATEFYLGGFLSEEV
jgi:AAA15 family ATPase/GTPase